MSLPVKSRRLCVCLLNVSEGRRKTIVENIANAALAVNSYAKEKGSRVERFPIRSAVLNIFSDEVYNRSVITIAAQPEHISESVHDACCAAFETIDLREHHGGHPRLGAVDLIPFHPVSGELRLEECGTIARDFAARLTRSVPGMSGFLFGAADVPAGRGLVQRRKEVGWFAGKHGECARGEVPADVGVTPNTRCGLTGIGAIPYVMNCNVTIATSDVALGRRVASAIRATTTPGGLPGVQSMAFPHQGGVEIACNVEGVYLDPRNQMVDGATFKNLTRSFGNCYHVSPEIVENRIRSLAAEKGVCTVGRTIVGFTPQEAERSATEALACGQGQYWKYRETLRKM